MSKTAPDEELGSDGDLLVGLRRRDPEAFEDLVRRFAPRMRATARRLLRSEDDADDVVQEAFLSAYRHLDRFEGKARVETWLQRILINAALMKLRARRGGPRMSATIAVRELVPRFGPRGAFAEAVPAWTEPVEETAARHEACDVVRDCIGRLPEKYRIPLVLHDIEELDNRETAGLLGISVNAAKIRVHRARQALRTLIQNRFAP